MCLPRIGKIIARDASGSGTVESAGTSFAANLLCVPEAEIGMYVMVHAGIALAVLSPAEADDRLELVDRLRSGPLQHETPE